MPLSQQKYPAVQPLQAWGTTRCYIAIMIQLTGASYSLDSLQELLEPQFRSYSQCLDLVQAALAALLHSYSMLNAEQLSRIIYQAHLHFRLFLPHLP